MARPSIDFQKINEIYGEKCLVVQLSEVQVAYLMAITPLLGWKATWRLEPGRDKPTTLPDGILPVDIQSSMEDALMSGCSVNDALAKIEEAIRQIPNCCVSGGGGGAGTSTSTQDVDAPPIGDDGSPEGWPDDVDYSSYKCGAAGVLVDSVVAIFQKFQDNGLFSAEDAIQLGVPTLVSILTAIVGLALTGVAGLVVAIVGLMAGFAVRLVVGGWDSAEIVSDIQSASSLRCCLELASSKDAVIDCFADALAGNSDNVRVVSWLLRYGNMANWLFEHHDEISSQDCACRGECSAEKTWDGQDEPVLLYFPCEYIGYSVPEQSHCAGEPAPVVTVLKPYENLLYENSFEGEGMLVTIENMKGLAHDNLTLHFKMQFPEDMPQSRLGAVRKWDTGGGFSKMILRGVDGNDDAAIAQEHREQNAGDVQDHYMSCGSSGVWGYYTFPQDGVVNLDIEINYSQTCETGDVSIVFFGVYVR